MVSKKALLYIESGTCENRSTTQKHTFVNVEAVEDCFMLYSDFLNSNSEITRYGNLPQKLPLDANKDGEKSGWYERWIGLRSTTNEIAAIDKQKKLDVQFDVRVLYNLNRIQKEFFDRKTEINKKK